jgi:hypothetical protein
MLIEYVKRAMRRAKFEKLEDDGSVFGTVRGLRGVWANERTLRQCRASLAAAVEDWVLFRIANGMKVPTIDGVTVRVKRAS